MDGQHLDWYVVRATGFVAWALVTVAVLYGLLHASRAVRRPRPAWVLDLHRFLGALACCATVLHVGALLFDQFVGFTLVDLMVPYATRYRPAALAWGIVAFDLLLIVEGSSLLMRVLSRRVWHTVHLASFVVFAATTVHALTAGTDRESPLTRGFAIAAVAAVAAAAVARLCLRVPTRSPIGARAGLDAPRDRVPTLVAVDQAIEEVVHVGAARRRRLARAGHRLVGLSRGAPR
jgi:hypothetical protein